MLKKIVLILILITITLKLYSQENTFLGKSITYADTDENQMVSTTSILQNTTVDFKKHWSFGGNLGLSFWNGGTDILVAPKAYYNISPMFLTGVGITYIYSNYNSGAYNYNSNSFGGSVMGAVRPIPFLQLSVEYEGLQTNHSGYYNEEYWNNALFLGISFVSGNVSFGLRYDVLYDDLRSAYTSALTPVLGLYF